MIKKGLFSILLLFSFWSTGWSGKIVYPFIGIRYVLINEKIKEKYDLTVDYGVLIIEGDSKQPAITPGSPAEEAELEEDDIVLEINGEKIEMENTLADIILKYNPTLFLQQVLIVLFLFSFKSPLLKIN